MHSNLYIHDEEFQEDGESLYQRAQRAEEVLGKMLAIMELVSEDAITDGNTAANYARLTETIRLLKNKFLNLGIRYKQVAASFIQNVEVADEDLY